MADKEYQNIRPSAVAGQFYPAEAEALRDQINGYLKSVHSSVHSSVRPKAILVPHAGYDFSGPVAAHGYKALEGRKIDTVILVCNSHQSYFPGIAVDKSDAWKTPLGLVEVDREMAEKIVASGKNIRFSSEAHAGDHVLEVQLPFLQTVLAGNFKIVPVLFGNTKASSGYEELSSVLAENLGENDMLVFSSDLSHYPAYVEANEIDKKTLALIAEKNIGNLEKHIKETEAGGVANEQTLCCGIDGVKTAMRLADELDWDYAQVLQYANSGDAAIGDKSAVVGYGAVVFGAKSETSRPAGMARNPKQQIDEDSFVESNLNNEQKQELLKIARETVEEFVRHGEMKDFSVIDERLNWQEGAFVTLKINGQLRGCIGQIVPSEKPLWQVVRDMAVSACADDPRFNPVAEKELDKLEYEVSVLSAPKPIADWQKIELGKHGVIVRQGFRSGVFLPQVAGETGWTREEFLSQLCSQKAGLPSDCYRDPDTELLVFTAQVF